MGTSMTRRWLVLALFASAVLLAAPASTRADVIGSGLSGPSSPVGCEWYAACILTQGDLHGDSMTNVVPRAGTITDFTFRDVSGQVQFLVLRQPAGGDVSVVNYTEYVSGSGSDELQRFTITPSGMDVQAGDFIALSLADGTTVGARDASGETGTNFWELSDANPPVVATYDRPGELFLRASYRPWSSGGSPPDTGGGEQSGDAGSIVPDPLAALRAGKRPHIKLSHKAVRASKRYSISIRMRNPNGYRVKGKLTLAFKGFRKTKKFSLANKTSKKVSFKLSRKAARRLLSRRKVRAKLKARFRGPIGKTGTASARITVKAPKVRKPRRRNDGNDGNDGIAPPGCVEYIEQDSSGWPHRMYKCG